MVALGVVAGATITLGGVWAGGIKASGLGFHGFDSTNGRAGEPAGVEVKFRMEPAVHHEVRAAKILQACQREFEDSADLADLCRKRLALQLDRDLEADFAAQLEARFNRAAREAGAR